MVMKTRKAVSEKDYGYDIHAYENPEERFYNKHSSKDFEKILRQAKGPFNFCLWRIQNSINKVLRLFKLEYTKDKIAHVPNTQVK